MGVISPLLAVRNMKETIAFYKNSLGFKIGMAFPDADNPEYADLSKDGMVLMVIPAQDHGIDIGEKLGIGVYLHMASGTLQSRILTDTIWYSVSYLKRLRSV